jgi:hypothetical protein
MRSIPYGVNMGIIEDVGNIAELIKKIGDMELYKQILTLETEVRELTRDKRRSDDKVEELERTLKLQKELVFKTPFYYLGDDPAPYCPGCWESKRLGVHLVRAIIPGFGVQMECPSCKHHYSFARV